MKKSDEKTQEKLEQLSMTLGIDLDEQQEPTPVSNETSPFKTSEVVILLLLTCVVSLLMGGVVTYRITYNRGKTIDKELGEFINNYNYITNNYYKKVDKEELIDAAINGMLSTLDKNSMPFGSADDSFSKYLDGEYKGIGVTVINDDDNNVVIYSVIENSPAAKAGIKAGDIITKINNESVLNKKTSYLSSIIKKQKKEFTLTYKRKEEEKTVKIKVSEVSLPSVRSDVIEREDNKIGYIRMSIFAYNSDSQFEKNLKKLEDKKIDSLIIDLRSNNGGHLKTAENIVSLFLDSSHTIYQIEQKGKINKYKSKGKADKKYKIVILVNGSSASASELMSSALSEQYEAVLVGTKTYGKGTVQEVQTLTDGSQYKLTTKKWLTSKGKQIDGVGIKPDVEVKLGDKFIEDPSEKNDNQLQEAIKECLK